MIVAALPIVPRDGDKCWAFHVVNDEREPFDEIVVEGVHYEWGDLGNSEAIGRTLGPLAPGASLEVYRETDTEVRTSLTLRVRTAARVRRVWAEVGRLYSPSEGNTVDIAILGRRGKVAELTED